MTNKAPSNKNVKRRTDKANSSSEEDMDTEYEAYATLMNRPRIQTVDASDGDERPTEVRMAPLFSWAAKKASVGEYKKDYQQYALLGKLFPPPMPRKQEDPRPETGSSFIPVEEITAIPATEKKDAIDLVFLNTNAPWSAFICGQQGSGKSYTLSCMLEDCLLVSKKLGKLPNPLAGMVFNYDSQSGGVCEAAYLCSAQIPVTVLVSPSNLKTMEKKYKQIPGAKGNLTIEPLYLKPSHLNTERMKRLMACGDNDTQPPLYMQTVIKTLRVMAQETQGDSTFDYNDFRRRLYQEGFTREQEGPLELRLSLLESFMEGEMKEPAELLNIDEEFVYGLAVKKYGFERNKLIKDIIETDSEEKLMGRLGGLKIIDLTDPTIDSDSACVLFDICLAIFLEKTECARIIALDEAHNYISKGLASDNFTNNILKAIREQRHKGARVIVATQEPTVSPKFLDLCSMTIAHKFDSPDWWRALKGHLRGASSESGFSETHLQAMFRSIGNLRTGESLLFSGNAMVDVNAEGKLQRLDDGHKKMMTRPRLSDDGGESVMADK